MEKMEEQTNDTRKKRLRILDYDEIEAIYGLPRFTIEEQIRYFSLSPVEKAALDRLHTIRSKISFILHLGYFKSHRMFFVLDTNEVEKDISYIRERYFPCSQVTETKVSKKTRLKHQHMILELCNYQNCDGTVRRNLEIKAGEAAKICGKPLYVFREIMRELEEKRIVIPGYTFLQEIVGKALNSEQNRMTEILRRNLDDSDISDLDNLLKNPSGLHEITYLRREPKDFTSTEIKNEIRRGQRIRGLYRVSQKILGMLEISNESIRYYASLVTFYSVFRLKRFDSWTVHTYLLCFIHYRYQRHCDNLLMSLIFYVRKFVDSANSAAKERVYAHRIETNQDCQKAAHVLRLFTSGKIARDTPYHEVRGIAFDILDRPRMEAVADHIENQVVFDEKAFIWDSIGKLGHQFKIYLRPILLSIDFEGLRTQTSLIEAMDFLKNAFGKKRSVLRFPEDKIPIGFIPLKFMKYLYDKDDTGNKRIVPDRYEFFVFRTLCERLESGDIYCRDSVRFRSFKDDLIDDQNWKRKDEIIGSIGVPILRLPIGDHLASLEHELENRIEDVNRRIATGENEYINIRRQGNNTRWNLIYPGGREDTNHSFFDALRQVNIASVIDFVNRHCQFMNAFEHVLGRYVRHKADYRVITACILGWGTNMGIGRMSQISDVDYDILSAASDNFIRLETLREANDIVSNSVAKMSVFRHFDIGGIVHSSSDGQKFETGIHTINARHSPKYFGLGKGVVSYTMVSNHIPVNAKIIGANEHESHYVFDILSDNTSEIRSKVHSTDTHGTNNVNSAILHIFAYLFAPRYKDIFDKVRTSFYGFRHPSQYENCLIRPVRKINKELIIGEWENIQRIMISLALKTTTQSIIVRKLCSHSRKNKTQRALWEYDNIISSLYLINFIDDPELRRNVCQSLNRGENYHQLRRAVAYANFGKIRFGTEYEQQIWEECSRLITNCIICYNAAILSNFLKHRASVGDIENTAIFKNISPVAWQHINLYGRYEFIKRPEKIEMKEIIEELSKVII